MSEIPGCRNARAERGAAKREAVVRGRGVAEVGPEELHAAIHDGDAKERIHVLPLAMVVHRVDHG